ncbi:30S ribosomal protein S2 [Chlamydiifrater volucris]|uniref:30S ribosomal protein S2 n=1 Tax=Chlamydiifrater volucris TaxID=2681470 RepID=UPI001BCC1C3A
MESQNLPITIKELIEAGAHFGHQKRRWNPKMKRFIFEERNGLYIINLAKTLQKIREAVPCVKKVVGEHKSILFVGTKKQAKGVVREAAEASGEFYVCERWLGGMLTNMSTIRQSVKTLEKTEHELVAGQDYLTKKELSLLAKKRAKLDRNLSGVRFMKQLPGLLVVVDPSYERIAVAEAKKLGIPVLALVDTNCDPTPIDHIIPCNDDSLKSIKLVVNVVRDAVVAEKTRLGIAISPPEESLAASNISSAHSSTAEQMLSMKFDDGGRENES